MSRSPYSAGRRSSQAPGLKRLLLLGPLAAGWGLALDLAVVAAAAPAGEAGTVSTPPPARSKWNERRRSGAPDICQVGKDVLVRAGETFRDVAVVRGSARIEGTVRDLLVINGSAWLGSNSLVEGKLTVIGGTLEALPGSIIVGKRVVVGPDFSQLKPWVRWPTEWLSQGLLWWRPLPPQFAWAWAVAAMCLALYAGTALLFPRPVQTCGDLLASRPGSVFLAGLLAFGLGLSALVLLVVSVIGLAVVPLLVAALLAAFVLGKAAFYQFAGRQVAAHLGWVALQGPLPALLLGAALCYGLFTIPMLGLVVWAATAPLALGSAALVVAQKVRSSETPAAGAPVPVAVQTHAVAAAEPPVSPASVLAAPRAGFWLRLLATAMDLALVTVVVILLRLQKAFIPIWTAYHLLLWTWKGATVGGLICGLRLVRTDGQRVGLAVALLRALAAFLSAAALFVGFFWTGWTRSRQSWHDKIAGTVMVKWRRAAPTPAGPTA